MSDRRAAVRRERKERAKIERNKSSNGEMMRAAEQGKIDGRAIAFCVIANLLYDLHGFRKKRIMEFLEKSNKEAVRSERDGVQFVVKNYADKLLKKINCQFVYGTSKDIKELIYMNQRDAFYVSSIALMLAVLNADYGMASNGKNTGRLDTLMEYCTNEYMKLQLDPDGHTADWYMKHTREKIGLEM